MKERNIDLDEAASVTRIRRYNLEALENEEWDKLPSRVFIKGFLKSYAEFLGLDKGMILDYYQRISPYQEYKLQALKGIDLQSARWYLVVILSVLVLVFFSAIIYFKKSDILISDTTLQHLETPISEQEKKNLPLSEDEEGEDDKVQEDNQEEFFLEAENEDTVEKESEIELGLESGEVDRIFRELPISDTEKPEEVFYPQYTLTANINKQTWIAIYIDDKPVKEYLFKPGSAAKWTAEKGFDILVGNAGGIEFSLNGNPVGSLGTEGRVVRLQLP